MTGAPGQRTATAESEVDLADLGPATRLAIKVALNACDDGIRKAETKLAIRSLNGEERRYWETDLHGWKVCRHQLLTQDYPPPYRTGSAYSEPTPSEESPTGR